MSVLRRIRKETWALVALSALLQGIIFPIAGPVPIPRATFAWIALVPLIVALLLANGEGRIAALRQAAWLGYGCGVLWYLGNCYWIYQTMYLYGGLPRPVAMAILLLFALYLGLYHAIFATLLRVIQRSQLGTRGALLAAPFLWVSVELARSRITGFPWDLLGYSQIDNRWLTRLAPVAGVMAMSFAIAAVNAGLAAYFFAVRRGKYWIPGTAVIFALIFEAGLLVDGHDFLRGADQQAVMLQENIEVGAPGRNVIPLTAGEEIRLFSHLSTQPAVMDAQSQSGAATILIWPEAPSHFFTSDRAFISEMGYLTRRMRLAAIVGSIGIEPAAQSDKGYYEYDSASLFDANGVYHGHYDKIHLVPWGEYVPFKQFFSFAQKLTEGVGNMDPGSVRSVFRTGGKSYGTFICYESIFGDEVRKFALTGAEVLVNISDDGWYGDTGAPWQHLNMTRMRAIENRRWLLLDTNTGITTSIDPEGRTHAEAPRHTRGAYMFPFAFETGVTFYTRYGDWFGWVCVLVSLGAVGSGMLRFRR